MLSVGHPNLVLTHKGQPSAGGELHKRPQEQDDGVRPIGAHHLRPLAGWSRAVFLTRTENVAARPESGGKITNGDTLCDVSLNHCPVTRWRQWPTCKRCGVGFQTSGSHSAISVRRFAPACHWVPQLQDYSEFQVLILRNHQTCNLSRSHLMGIELRDEKILAGLKSFDLRVIVTGRRLPLVWSLSGIRRKRRKWTKIKGK